MDLQQIDIFNIVQPKPGTPKDKRRYRVKWRLDGRDHSKQFKTKAQAERLRSQLLVARSEGQTFDRSTGKPTTWERSTETWWSWSRTWVGLKWPEWSGNSRRSGVESLTAVAPFMLRRGAPAPPDDLRSWLRDVGYVIDAQPTDDDARFTAWLDRWSVELIAVDPPTLERALLKATTRRDGVMMAPTVVRRRRNLIKSVFTVAVRRRLIESNPFDQIELRLPKRSNRVDISTVPSIPDLRTIVGRVAELKTDGAQFSAYFSSIGLAGFRPSEASGLMVDDLELPARGWGLARLRGATTAPGRRYSTSGETRENKELKHRAVNEVREVPLPPELVANLQAHMCRWPPIDGRTFSNGAGHPILAHNYGKVWRRERALLWPTGHPCSTATVYDLRHTAATMMLRAGVNPSEVALRLGHSVDMLMKVYAGVFDDERNRSNELIDKEMRRSFGDSLAAQPFYCRWKYQQDSSLGPESI